MRFHGVDCQGKLHVQEVATLPTWQSSDERRVIYVKDAKMLYFGTDTGWDTGSVLVDEANERKYRLHVWNGNLNLQEIVIT